MFKQSYLELLKLGTMAKEFKNGERVEFRPWETAPAKDRVTGEIVGGVVEGEYYMMLPDWAKRKGELTNLKKIHWSQLYSI